MNDSAITHALFLGITVLVLCLLFFRSSNGKKRGEAKNGDMAPFLAESDTQQDPDPADDEAAIALLRKRYTRKTRFRLGVLAMSLLALGSYLGLESRALALLFLAGAGVCQYGAYKQRTTAGLVNLLQQSRLPGAERRKSHG